MSKYRQPILDYCTTRGIEVPDGFARHTPSRYAVIRLDGAAPKLVARTFFKVADLIHYLDTRGDTPGTVRLIDFDRGCLLHRAGRQLRPGDPI